MSAQPPSPGPTPAPPNGHRQQAVPPPPPQAVDPQGQPPAEAAAGRTTLSPSTILQLAAAALTVLALALSSDGQESWYSQTPAWAVFATVAAVVQVAPFLVKIAGWSAERTWTVGAIGAGGLFAWWVLIALPAVSSNQGFVATMAVAAALIGSWLAPGRRL